MNLIIVWIIYNVIVALIESIGKKWDNELNQIWVNQFKFTIKYVWIPILADVIVILITLIFTGTIINIVM